jgi:hypothetical protein
MRHSGLARVAVVAIAAWSGSQMRSDAGPFARPPSPKVTATSGTGWPEYDALAQRHADVSAELMARNNEVVATYGRNDGPEALAILEPLRRELRDLEAKRTKLLQCEPRAVTDPAAMFAALNIKTQNLGRPDGDSLRAYVESRVMDGSITRGQEERLFLILRLRSRGIMNPASKGASEIAYATAGALSCFGIDTPGTGAPRPGARSTEPVLLATKFAQDHRIALYRYHQPQIGNVDGHFAPIVVLPDGGTLIVGTHSDIPPGGKYEIGKSHPMAVRLAANGQLAWQKDLRKKGFLDFEGGSAAVTSSGDVVVFILDYKHPARGAVARFVELDGKGKTVWERELRGDGGRETPFPSSLVQLTRDGSISLQGHLYGKDGRPYAWTGAISGKGELIADTVGAPLGGAYGGTSYGGTTYGGGR